MAEKRRLNIFEEAMKVQTSEQTTPPMYALEIIDEETWEAMEYIHLTKCDNKEIREGWTISFANEIGNLAKCVGGCIKATDTIYFINHEDIQEDIEKWPMAALWCVIAHKSKTHTVNSSQWKTFNNYPGDVVTTPADMLICTFLLNSILSMLYAKFIRIDIKKCI